MQFPAVIELSALAGSDGFVLNGVLAGDASGMSIGAAGDVNGDGVDDLIVGAYRADPNGSSSGASYIVFGRTSGFAAAIELSSLSGSDGFALNGGAASDFSGYSVGAAGDVNGDGIDDLIVGALGDDFSGRTNAGGSYVVFGRTSGFAATVELTSLGGSDGFVLMGAVGSGSSGNSVSAAGDVNGDGIDDVIVGAYRVGPLGGEAGASYVVFGRTSGFAAEVDLASLGGSDGFVLNGASTGDHSGRRASAAGDVNGDGIDDVIVGAPRADPNGSYSGAAHVVFGRTSGFAAAVELSSLSGSDGFALHGVASSRAGMSVSAAGDVDGDGLDDVIVGAYYADPNGGDSGATYVVFGRTSAFAAAIELSSLNGSDGFVLNGVAPGDRSGRFTSAAGDVNDDGIDDLIVGTTAGASFIVFGRTSGFAAEIELSSLDGSAGFALNGAGRVGTAGDVNGDGIDDPIVGNPGISPGGRIFAGVSYVVFGRPPPDTTPPDAPTVDAIADDTGTPGDAVTTDRTLTVSGTAEPLATVRLFRGASEVGETTADADGTWSLADPATLAYGGHLYRAEAEDEAGNVGDRSDPLLAFVVNPGALPTAGNDLVLGTAGGNQIQGGEGSDTIFGEGGTDTLKGSNGNDWLFGGEGSDRVEGENGNDVARGGNGDDTVYGQNGRDTISGDNGNDRLEGGSDADSVVGGNGADTLFGGAGTDTLVGGAGGDRISGDADPDWIDLGDDTARDTVFGTIAHLNEDTIDGFVGGAAATPGADLLLIAGLTNAQAKKLDGDLLDEDGVLSLADVGGGSITFEGHDGATVDAIFTAGGVQVWLL